MTSARQEYFERVGSILSCFEKQHEYNNFLNELAPNAVIHNTQARLIRNGLAISNFCFFEDFIKSRLGECISDLPNIFSNFQNLPDNLQQLITLTAIESIHKRSDNIKRSNTSEAILFIQEHTKHIGSTFSNDNSFTTSKFSIGWSKENINYDDFINFLGIFHIKKCNDIIKNFSSHLHSPIIDPKLEFNQISTSRHKAAHVASYNITIEDLKKNIKNTLIFAFIFDFCITYSIKLFSIQENDHLDCKFNFHHNHPLFRTIIENNENSFSLYYKSHLKAIKKLSNFSDAENETKSRLKNKEFFILKLKNESFIKRWHLNF